MKYGRDIFGIIFIFVVFLLIATLAEPYVFDFLPPKISEDITMEQWTASFQRWARIGSRCCFPSESFMVRVGTVGFQNQ